MKRETVPTDTKWDPKQPVKKLIKSETRGNKIYVAESWVTNIVERNN